MHANAIDHMGQIIKDLQPTLPLSGCINVLEFGSGGSTVWFDRQDCRVIAVEHQRGWAEKVRRACSWRVYTVTHPVPYAGLCDYFPDGMFNIVLVDGRGRVECVERSMRVVTPGGYLILDDANRYRYRHARRRLELAGWEHVVVQALGPVDSPMIVNAPNHVRTTTFYQKPAS
jgi:hypothetical protein